MALKFEIDTLEGLEESVAGLYVQHGEKFRLAVDGIDPADELKEALRKEREERAAAKAKLSDFEKAQEEAERKRLEEKQEYESLYKTETETSKKVRAELEELKAATAKEKRELEALKVVSALTSDDRKGSLLGKEAMQFIHYTPEGIKINGPDGEAWDASKLKAHLEKEFDFLVDSKHGSGGGATGSKTGGGAVKKFNEYSGGELKDLRANDPQLYDRLRTEHYGS